MSSEFATSLELTLSRPRHPLSSLFFPRSLPFSLAEQPPSTASLGKFPQERWLIFAIDRLSLCSGIYLRGASLDFMLRLAVDWNSKRRSDLENYKQGSWGTIWRWFKLFSNDLFYIRLAHKYERVLHLWLKGKTSWFLFLNIWICALIEDFKIRIYIRRRKTAREELFSLKNKNVIKRQIDHTIVLKSQILSRCFKNENMWFGSFYLKIINIFMILK